MKPTLLQSSDFTDLEIERFWTRVNRDQDGCWPWQGLLNDTGYGSLRMSIGIHYAHRVAYALTRGQTPDGLTLDHTCHNKRCCNPDHLEPVSQSVNIKRWWALQDRSTCDCGAPRRPRGRDRRCLSCYNSYMREYMRRRKA